MTENVGFGIERLRILLTPTPIDLKNKMAWSELPLKFPNFRCQNKTGSMEYLFAICILSIYAYILPLSTIFLSKTKINQEFLLLFAVFAFIQ